MAEPPVYVSRFTFGRLFADIWRVLAGAGLPLAVGMLVLAAPIMLAALPWWQQPANMPDETFSRIRVAVTTLKSAINLFSLAVEAAFVSAVSLKVLTGLAWAEMLAPRRLLLGVATAVCLHLLTYWPTLAAPLVGYLWASPLATSLFGVALLIAYFSVLASIGIAVQVALAEGLNPLAAIARAFRLLASLRWRIASIGIGYGLLVGLATRALELLLTALGVGYYDFGPGRAALFIAPVLIGGLSYIAIASLYLQARRIADGPSAVELHEVFA